MTHPPAFVLRRRAALPTREGEFLEWVHSSGARVLHFATPDTCRVFSASFTTPPPDDSGVAHVLEHLVLCGSRCAPSSQPFFEAQSRSCRDYMNASTTRDWTAYTFASRLDSDYFELLELYLDACFHPLLRPESFEREAVRLEADGYQGVVYNEMCGAMSHSARAMRDLVGRALFPGSPYALNSGGDPRALTRLTLQEVRAYHAAHYTAQNACFYSSGDLDTVRLLERLDLALREAPQGVRVRALPPAGPPLPRLEGRHPGGDQVLLAWATAPGADSLEHFALSVLSYALLGHPGAPLSSALAELAPTLADHVGFHSEAPHGVFTVGVRGCTDLERVRATVHRVLEGGLDDALIEATLTRFELEDRDLSHGAVPYGVKRMFSVLSAHHHGADPLALARLEGGIRALRNLPDRAAYLRRLIRTHVLENPWHTAVLLHRGTLEPLPAPPLRASGAGTAQRTLEPAAGNRPAAPMLRGLPEPLPEPRVTLEPLEGLPVPAWRVRPLESGLTHLTLSGTLGELPPETLALLPLYGALASRSASAGQAHTLTAQLQTQGALWQFGVDTHHAPHDPTQVTLEWSVNIKGLSERLPEALGLLRGWVPAAQFSPQTLALALEERVQGFQTLCVSQGHHLALLQAALGASPAPLRRDALDGQRAHQQLEAWRGTDPLTLLARLEALHRHLWCRPGLEVLVVSDLDQQVLRDALSPLLEALPAHTPPAPEAPQGSALPLWSPRAGVWTQALPVPVASGAWAYRGVPYTHPDAPALFVLARMLHERLHVSVRETGGAYGALCRASAEQGLVVCASLRDPAVGRSVALFQNLRGQLEPLNGDDLERAQIAALRLLRPLSALPGAARRAFADSRVGYHPALRAAFEAGVRACTPADLRRVASRHLRGGSGAVLASQAALERLSPSFLQEIPHAALA